MAFFDDHENTTQTLVDILFEEAEEFVLNHLNRGANLPYSLCGGAPYFEITKVPANGMGWYTLRCSYVNMLNVGDRPFLYCSSDYPILLRNWNKEELPWWFNIHSKTLEIAPQPIHKVDTCWICDRPICPVITIYCENCNKNLQCGLPYVRIEHI